MIDAGVNEKTARARKAGARHYVDYLAGKKITAPKERKKSNSSTGKAAKAA